MHLPISALQQLALRSGRCFGGSKHTWVKEHFTLKHNIILTVHHGRSVINCGSIIIITMQVSVGMPTREIDIPNNCKACLRHQNASWQEWYTYRHQHVHVHTKKNFNKGRWRGVCIAMESASQCIIVHHCRRGKGSTICKCSVHVYTERYNYKHS